MFFSRRVLNFFHTTCDEYTVIFTAGCTAALSLVAQMFVFSPDEGPVTKKQCISICQSTKSSEPKPAELAHNGVLFYLEDNHTSVVGMREVAMERGIHCHCLLCEDVFNHQEKNCLCNCFANKSVAVRQTNNLFVFPAQSNFNGHKYPLDWVAQGQAKSLIACPGRLMVCLDAASFCCTSSIDLSLVQPDFMTVSFYKIFGFPTGLGKFIVID